MTKIQWIQGYLQFKIYSANHSRHEYPLKAGSSNTNHV